MITNIALLAWFFMNLFDLFTLSFAEFVSLGSSSNAASEVGERNASLSVNNSLEISLGSFNVKSSKSSDNFEGVLEVNSKVGSWGLHSYFSTATRNYYKHIDNILAIFASKQLLNLAFCSIFSLLLIWMTASICTFGLNSWLTRVNSLSHLCLVYLIIFFLYLGIFCELKIPLALLLVFFFHSHTSLLIIFRLPYLPPTDLW